MLFNKKYEEVIHNALWKLFFFLCILVNEPVLKETYYFIDPLKPVKKKMRVYFDTE